MLLALLSPIDARVAARVAAERCPFCGSSCPQTQRLMPAPLSKAPRRMAERPLVHRPYCQELCKALTMREDVCPTEEEGRIQGESVDELLPSRVKEARPR